VLYEWPRDFANLAGFCRNTHDNSMQYKSAASGGMESIRCIPTVICECKGTSTPTIKLPNSLSFFVVAF
jgi:hypothetical protein